MSLQCAVKPLTALAPQNKKLLAALPNFAGLLLIQSYCNVTRALN